jgi:hypothetical protein
MLQIKWRLLLFQARKQQQVSVDRQISPGSYLLKAGQQFMRRAVSCPPKLNHPFSVVSNGIH